jgi:hypothetical protein
MPKGMSGFTQHGNQDYRFGFKDPAAENIADAVGLKPQTLSISGEPEFTAEGKNLEGLTEAFVVAKEKFSFTMSGFIVDLENFGAPGATFDYDGNHFIVTGRKRDVSSQDFQKGEITGMSYPLIDGN